MRTDVVDGGGSFRPYIDGSWRPRMEAVNFAILNCCFLWGLELAGFKCTDISLTQRTWCKQDALWALTRYTLDTLWSAEVERTLSDSRKQSVWKMKMVCFWVRSMHLCFCTRESRKTVFGVGYAKIMSLAPTWITFIIQPRCSIWNRGIVSWL